ncbi:MAG: PQQ-binding-like beta-propeller repeat protein [Eubacteriales bacterium]|nr:PQQ-binding-like beta-propeller repeat protein [Eubacteriales bacterium]
MKPTKNPPSGAAGDILAYPGKKKKHIGLFVFLAILVLLAAVAVVYFVPFGKCNFSPAPTTLTTPEGSFVYFLPLDSESPWAKFRANDLQNGRTPVVPKENDKQPWVYQTDRGIFSSPVIDGNGNCYIGSADTNFYCFHPDGSIKWSYQTGEIIDSSALLDNKGRVIVASGDANTYCFNRETGELLWKFTADTAEQLMEKYGIKTWNVNWFEGNVGMLPDGTLLVPNDNCLVYCLDPDTGAAKSVFTANDLIWSLPAVNTKTGNIFFATCHQLLQNVFSYNVDGTKRWIRGDFLGTVAATTMLTNDSENGAVLVGGFDGYLRAMAQDSGKQLWAFGTNDHIYASPAQLSDGTILQASTDGTLYAIDPNTGKAIWEFDTLEPIRSSPAVDGNDNVYFGNGEGKLYCINPDGTLRWSYRCIQANRNDLNGSPALGNDGIYIAGESGEVFFVPYDYPLTAAGKQDPRSFTGGEDMPSDGADLVFTTSFGALEQTPEASIAANDPITLSLMVRKDGDNVLSALVRNSVLVTVPGNEGYRVEVGATNKFVNIIPKEYWAPDADGNITVTVTADYKTNLSRFGLKFFGGTRAGTIKKSFTFQIVEGSGAKNPFVTAQDGAQSVIELSRLSMPTPSMLPSYNQIGFDSLHYIGGVLYRNANGQAVVWVIEGRQNENGDVSINPDVKTRYPLLMDYKDGLVTFSNYSGFKINFIGTWDMPFASYRINTALNANGEFDQPATITAVANCDEIAYYGPGLKLTGMSEFRTGQMFARGACNISARENTTMPDGVGTVEVKLGKDAVTAMFTGSAIRADEHVVSILPTDKDGLPLSLYYTKNTAVEANDDGTVRSVTVSFDKGEDVSAAARAYVLVDTYPVFVETKLSPAMK